MCNSNDKNILRPLNRVHDSYLSSVQFVTVIHLKNKTILYIYKLLNLWKGSFSKLKGPSWPASRIEYQGDIIGWEPLTAFFRRYRAESGAGIRLTSTRLWCYRYCHPSKFYYLFSGWFGLVVIGVEHCEENFQYKI